VEVDDHGQEHAELNEGGDDQEGPEVVEGEAGELEETEEIKLGEASPEVDGFGKEAEFDAHLRDAGIRLRIAAGVSQLAKSAGEGLGGGIEEGDGEGANEGDGKEGELEAGVEQLLGISKEEEDADGGEDVEEARAAVQETGAEKEGEPGGGTDGRGGGARHDGVNPTEDGSDGEGGDSGQTKEAEQEEETGGKDGEVNARDDDGMEGAGAAVIVGPDAFEAGGVADEDSAAHAEGVRIGLEEGIETVDGGFAEGVDGGKEARAAALGKALEAAGGTGGGKPVDVAAGKVVNEVESAGVAEVAGGAEAGFEFDLLAVAEAGWGFAGLDIPIDAGAGAGGEFEDKLFAIKP
jgi:hypothetical protein